MIATIPPTLTNKERLVIVRNEQVYDYCLQLCDILDERFRQEFPTLNQTFTVDKGRKYYRVWAIDNQKTIHCFVNIKTGDVFKPESYNKPAKHVRYNLLDDVSRQSMFEKAHYAGGYLYLK